MKKSFAILAIVLMSSSAFASDLITCKGAMAIGTVQINKNNPMSSMVTVDGQAVKISAIEAADGKFAVEGTLNMKRSESVAEVAMISVEVNSKEDAAFVKIKSADGSLRTSIMPCKK